MAWTRVGLYHYANRKLPWLVRWYGEIEPSTGNPKRYSKSFRTKRQAEDFKAEKTHEFKKGIKRDRPEEVALGKLCEDFLRTWNPNAREATVNLYKYTIQRLLGYFGEKRLISTIDPREADGFIAAQIYHKGSSDRKLSDWARAQIANHCKTIFKVAVRWQWIAKNPFADVRKPKPVVKKWHRLAVDDYFKLLDAAPTLRWKCFYALVYTSGARFGELFNLTWADIDFEHGRVNIQNREGSDYMPPFLIKDHETRFVQLPKHTIDLLAKYQNEAHEGVPFVLLTQDRYERVVKKWHKFRNAGKEWQNRYMVNNVARDFKVHAKRAGIEFTAKFTVHTFRKTCAQNWADRLPANVVKFYLGHSDMNTTNKFYSIVDQSHLNLTRNVMDKMLESGKIQNDLDTGWTLAQKNKKKSSTKNETVETDSSVNPSHISTSGHPRIMEPMGIEPTTSCMPCKRSPN